MMSTLLLLWGSLKYTSRVFPAARDDQKAIDRLIKIPRVPLRVKIIPRPPRMSIGKRAYPSVLITLYKGITSALFMKKLYLVHEVDQKVHNAIAEEKHCVNVTEVYFS
jgi:hypothetical protein